jgi:hypothetical protein
LVASAIVGARGLQSRAALPSLAGVELDHGGAQFPEGEHPVSVSEADSWAH